MQNKRAEQRRQQVILTRIAKKYERRISFEIARAMRRAAKAVSSGEVMAVQSVMGKHQGKIERLLNGLWFDSIDSFSGKIAELAKSSKDYEKKAIFDGLDDSTSSSIMADWVASIGLQKITMITSTTKNDIENIIAEGIAEGLSEKDIAKKINVVAPTKSASRSQTIARTEAHGAANYAANETAKAIGIDFNKEWVSAQTERTRETHIDADGQVVAMHEPFSVGGYSMMMPSDSSMGAPAGEIINCMCAVVYTPA